MVVYHSSDSERERERENETGFRPFDCDLFRRLLINSGGVRTMEGTLERTRGKWRIR
jgi:hypothetical protein